MSDYLTSAAWGLAILGTFAGWGRLSAAFLERGAPQNTAASWLESPALGIATCAFLGGVLNLFSLAGARAVAASVIAGNALLVIFALRTNARSTLKTSRHAPKPVFTAILALALSLLALRFISSISIDSFYPAAIWSRGVPLNLGDDFQSYIVSVERMLETGAIGLDPFNSRQVMSALGADHFLNGMTFSLLPYDKAHLLEGGPGLAAACFAAAALGLRWNLGKIPAVSLMLVPLLVDLSFVNISSTMTSSAILIALIPAASCFETHGKPDPFSMLRTGLLLSGACALKTTTIPPACLFVAAEAVSRAIHLRTLRPITGGLFTGVCAAILLLPWMIWQCRDGGTPLYPIFGIGFQSQAYNHIPFHFFPGYERGIILPNIILPATLSVITLFSLIFRRFRTAALAAHGIPVLAFLAAWMLSLVALGETTQIAEIFRYVASARLAGILAFLAFAWRFGLLLKAGGMRILHFAGPLTLVAIIAVLFPEWKVTYFSFVPTNLSADTRARPFSWILNFPSVRAMQANIPPGEKILVYLDTPFLMDFRRNTVYVADWPGETSPPPGMPIFKGGEAVADYLLKHGICYLAYSYKTEANFPRRIYNLYASQTFGAVIRRQAVESFAFQDDVAQLRHSRRTLFDDGQIVLLDLQYPPSTVAPP